MCPIKKMHRFWVKKVLHNDWYMQRRMPEILRSVFVYGVGRYPTRSETEERVVLFMKNTQGLPLRLVNSGAWGSIYVDGRKVAADDHHSQTPEMIAAERWEMMHR